MNQSHTTVTGLVQACNMTILKNLSNITKQIDIRCREIGRSTTNLKLLAVSKTWPAHQLRQLAEAGQRDFGENYLQEALEKIVLLQDLDLVWHFIGPIQSNKAKNIAENFQWVHSLDREKIAQRLNQHRPAHYPPLNVCIQLNIDNEASKSGISPQSLFDFAATIANYDRLCLRGIMIIPQQKVSLETRKQSFTKARDYYQQLAQRYPNVDTLSMGMSADRDIALACGTTCLRVGTALFGERTSH